MNTADFMVPMSWNGNITNIYMILRKPVFAVKLKVIAKVGGREFYVTKIELM